MKFTSLKKTPEKHLNIKAIDGGIDLSSSPLLIDDNCLTSGENVMFVGNTLKTRPGMITDTSKFLKCPYTGNSDYSKYFLTDSKIYIDRRCYRIATEYMEYDFSEYHVAIYLIDAEGTATYTGTLHFNRTSDDFFLIPTNITFFQGKAQSGGGIFALISLNNMDNYKDRAFSIYEINSSLSNWLRVTSFYIPTVYINGRGDFYEKAAASNQAYSASPAFLEAPNLLSGQFYAYFSSDGYSSAFRLPFSSLANDKVTCRIYRTPSSYTEWSVSASATSNVQSFIGVDVTMNVDRSKGMIYFTVAAGDYSIPLMNKYKANNIKITASKVIEDGFNDVASCTKSLNMNSRIILSGGIRNNRIYSARYENPLYFPRGDIAEIGESRLPVTAFLEVKNKILALKKNESFLINIKIGKAINEISLLADNDSQFFETDKFTVSTLSHDIGGLKQNSVATLGDEAVLYGSDGNIYSISQSGKIKNIGSRIKNILDEIPSYSRESVITVGCDKYCLFISENRAIAACYDNSLSKENLAFYVWELPKNMRITGGFSHSSSPIMLCRVNPNIGYCASFGGKEDAIITSLTDSGIISQKIKSSISTKHFSDNAISLRKRLNKIYMQLISSGNTEIYLNDAKVKMLSDKLKSLNTMKKITIYPAATRFNSVYIKLESDSYFELGELDIFYKELLN